MMGMDCMLDLETWGVSDRAVIVSIGAVKFDPYGDGVLDQFEVNVSPGSAIEHGCVVDADTVLWWMSPAREAPLRNWWRAPRVALPEALTQFAQWLGPDCKVWGNGVGFDNVILRNAYKACGLSVPWSPFDDRCYRTMKSRKSAPKMARVGVHHNSLDDATSQALHLQQIYRTM